MSEYIKREDVKRLVNINFSGLLAAIDSIPAADVAPVRHGRWIEKTAPAVHKYYECSNCGAHENKHTAIKGRYCWRCGARMDGTE